MKVALAYDYLNQLGGGERALKVLCSMFPEAPLYTIFHDAKKTDYHFAKQNLTTSFLDFQTTINHHRWFIPLMPTAASSLRVASDTDLLISVGAGYSKGISYNTQKTKHISYVLSPLRYAWEEHYTNLGLQSLNRLLASGLMRLATRPVKNYLKQWDYQVAQRPQILLADSKFIADKVRRYYRRSAEVLYPPYEENKFFPDSDGGLGDYFIAVGRLLSYKKFDLAITAFNKLNWPLKIVGIGPDYSRLKGLANKNIEFLGFVSDDNLRELYSNSRGLVFPQEEDFGIVPVEAQACGAPVLAFAGGGALETVSVGTTGLFFYKQDSYSLMESLKMFEKLGFDRSFVAQQARRFSTIAFKEKLGYIMRNV